ncbi:MAG TPA: hypothetical protein PLR79_00855 [Acinetobacter sp.]|jgi:MFS superfamily sulfate permease-like transporter|nr:hypothetical protein [Acinetobacter sp.]
MKKPNRVVAPIIIAGITVGFLVSAYKFVVAKTNSSKVKSTENTESSVKNETPNHQQNQF